ncbi:helix-turn-helix domain-containing protein [Methylobacterium radiodurans]|uniref:Transcriptional regulator n=1 Tax=Methylobacterium radiodurans TaxID=2202828 RepID=A0A2U8VPK0_9HYPH|nr:helix-turn-helix transcriptional regulator [Methylobacterium radiodurans]AWN35408.1 transcriptional regulator [Methylobacterium radiodurans]
MAGQKTDQRDVYVGQRIAEQRRKASLTQRRVAESFGMSAAQLQKYEKGTNRISAIHLDIFSRMTGVPLEYFFQGAPRLDDIAQTGFGEGRQHSYQAEGELQNLAEAVAQRMTEHLPESVRKDLAAAAQVFSRKLGA